MTVTNKTDVVTLKNALRSSQEDSEQFPENKKIRIGIAASYTVDAIEPVLVETLLDSGIKSSISIAPYNQIFQLCYNGVEEYFQTTPNVIILLIRIEDLFPDLVRRSVYIKSNEQDDLAEEMVKLISAINTLHENFEGLIFASTLPYPSNFSFDINKLNQITKGRLIHQKLQKKWVTELSSLSRLKFLDVDGCLSNLGYQNCYDARKWYLYKQPYCETVWPEIAIGISRILSTRIRAPKKCIVVDCDNTLWGGIVGEDGIGGIALGGNFPGNAFVDFQEVLLYFKNSGVFLAVASKNNEADVLEVFDSHDAMKLDRDDISVFEINWGSKVDSLMRIAETLNIGIDSLVFLDDNPKEISEVKARLPSIECLLVPEETAFLPDILRGSKFFDTDYITDDDYLRVHRMKIEEERSKVSATISKQDFIETLDLKIDVFKVQPEHVERITQLINKTNQFNLTTIRRTKETIEQMVASANYCVLALRATDRFGEYGIVGVVILQQQEKSTWEIINFLLSCRILGRGVETILLSIIDKVTFKLGGDKIIGEYIPTEKNIQAKEFYKDNNFEHEVDGKWSIMVGNIKTVPKYVEFTLEV